MASNERYRVRFKFPLRATISILRPSKVLSINCFSGYIWIFAREGIYYRKTCYSICYEHRQSGPSVFLLLLCISNAREFLRRNNSINFPLSDGIEICMQTRFPHTPETGRSRMMNGGDKSRAGRFRPRRVAARGATHVEEIANRGRPGRASRRYHLAR